MMLPKKNRLTKGFRAVLSKGERRKNSFMMAVYVKHQQHYARFGFIVTKKIGNAVVRNKVKRLLKHIVKENLAQIPNNISVVIIASPFVSDWKVVDKAKVRASLLELLTNL
jgi:ribonuclease P protein component